jgi:hypothetical protein
MYIYTRIHIYQIPSSHEKFFPKPNLLCPAWHSLDGVCHICQAVALLTAQENYTSLGIARTMETLELGIIRTQVKLVIDLPYWK